MKTEKNILIAFALNFTFSILEFIGGAFVNSIAIVSDAIHDMGDSLSIGLSYILEKISKKKPDNKYTYGYVRYSVIGSVITTTILLIGSIIVIYNATKRLLNPESINYNGMIVFAIIGLIINFSASYFTKGGDSLNQRSVNLHMLEDILNWIIVLIGAVIMRFTDILIIDPILSIGVALFIIYNALKNLKQVLDLFLEKTPEDIDITEIKKGVLEISGVEDIHHIHIWSLDSINNYATMHIVVKKYDKNIKQQVKMELKKHKIKHITIEIETKDESCCEKDCKIKEIKTKHHH